ncbi:insulinase family protein [Candidatus Poribacteria bacterium]|nr:insulinase family protein [Candidatus Poribacteria bacterium]
MTWNIHKNNPFRQVLDNGLVIIVQENHAIPAISISGFVKAGGMYDSQPPAPFDKGDEQAGCADFVANMLTRGTKNRTWQQIAEETESVGASIGVGCGMDAASFSARSLSKDFALALDILSDVLRNPTFPEEEIQKHRNQMLSSFKSWDDNPAQVGEKELRVSIYPSGHPYHRRLQGYEETISKFGRYNLLDFHRRYYRPEATILAVVGDIDANEAIAKIRELFGDWRSVVDPPAAFVIPPVEMREASKKIVSMMDKSQVEIFLGHKGISRTNPDFYAVDLMNRILGGSAGLGRLFNYVRDVQGLAYGVWSSFSAGIGEGPFIATAGVNPQNVEQAIQSILNEISRLRNDGITEQELADAKEMLIGNFSLSMETSSGIANVLLTSEMFELGLDYPKRHEQIYRAITKEQVEQAAREYLHPEKCSLVIAGPYTELGSRK